MTPMTLLERADLLIEESGGCPMPTNRCECSPDACLLSDLVVAIRAVWQYLEYLDKHTISPLVPAGLTPTYAVNLSRLKAVVR